MNDADEADTLSLSFLDVLCCGLGATIYVFLIFSVLPHAAGQGRAAGGARGQDRVASVYGAAPEEERERAVSPRLHVRVVADAAFDPAEYGWDGHPDRDRSQQFATPAEPGKPWVAGLNVPRGVHVQRPVTFTLTRAALARVGRDVKLEVWVFVGSRAAKQTLIVRRPGPSAADPVPVFRLKFTNKPEEWIVPEKP